MNTLQKFAPKISALLGIDGGATKTAFVLTDSEGKVISETKLTSCNPVDIGIEAAKEILRKGIITVTESIPAGKIACFAGISGGITGNNQTEISSLLSEFGFAIYANGSDAENAIAAALDNREGIVSITGTGCITYAVQGGKKYRIGGFGYLFDEGGSGYDIGAAAIRAALSQEDGTGENTLLHDMVTEKLSGSALENLGNIYLGGKSYIASFAPFVFEAYQKGDEAAEKILQQSTAVFGHQLLTAAKRFKNRPVKAYLIGGMTKNKEILIPFIEKAIATNPDISLTVCEKEPVCGALYLAKKMTEDRFVYSQTDFYGGQTE